MKKEEAAKVIEKIEIVADWFDEIVDNEYSISNRKAQDLIEALEAV